MENENILDTNLTGGLLVDNVAKQAFSETGSWGKFFAILMFISIVFMVLAGIGMIFFLGAMGSAYGAPGMSIGITTGLGLFYVMLAALYIMPGIYLWRFSTMIKSSINSNDQTQFTNAIVNLKSCYKFFGIMTIVIMGLYIVGIVISVFVGLSF